MKNGTQLLDALNVPEIGQKSSFLTSKSGGRHLLEHEHLLEQICITSIPLPHMLYLEHCIISINNSNFQIFSKKYFLHFNSLENIMKNVPFFIIFSRLLKCKKYFLENI